MLRIATVLCAVLLHAAPAPAQAGGHWTWPVRGEVITRYRNGSDPYAGGQHRGIDIAGPVGRAVVAPTGGRVTFVGTVGSSGLTVSLRTADGRFDTSYLHHSSTSVRRGQRMGRGERLGAVGTSGRRSAAAPHLHFGVRDAGSRHAYHDPLAFLGAPGPAHEPPRAAPAPLPLPGPARPGSAPAPQGAPAARRAPSLGPAPRHAPAPGPSPAPGQAGAAAALGTPGLVPLPALAPGRSGAARRAGQVGATAAGSAARQPARGAADSAASAARRPLAGGRGLDLGCALAVVGLLATAALLGRSAPAALPQRARAVVRSASSIARGWRTTSRPRSTT